MQTWILAISVLILTSTAPFSIVFGKEGRYGGEHQTVGVSTDSTSMEIESGVEVVNNVEKKITSRKGDAGSGEVQVSEVVLDLEELVRIALANNKLVQIEAAKIRQSQGQLTQAWSGYLPQVGVRSRYSYTEQKDSSSSSSSTVNDSSQLEGETFGNETEEDTVFHVGASISQLIYDFGVTTGEIGVGKANLRASDASHKRKLQDILFQVKQAYYDVLEKRRLIAVAEESKNSFQKHLRQAKIYKEAGIRTKIDVINAEVELSNAAMRLLRAQYDLKNSRVALEQILGIKPHQGNYILDNDNVNLGNILDTMPQLTDSIETLIETAMSKRPDVHQSMMLMEAVEAGIKQAEGDYWPKITAEANYNEYDTDLSLYKDSWEVGVAATWEIFSGKRTSGVVAEAKSRLMEQRAAVEDLRLAVIREVTETYLAADENRSAIQIALQTLELAKENVALAEKRYKSGVYDALEFNDAQLSLTRSRNDLVVTYYGYLTALAAIEFAVGEKSAGVCPDGIECAQVSRKIND